MKIQSFSEISNVTNCPGESLIFVDGTRSFSAILQKNASFEACDLILTAEKGKTIGFISNSSGSEDYFLDDLHHIQTLKKLAPCAPYYHKEFTKKFDSFSEEVFLRICLSGKKGEVAYNFTIQVEENGCDQCPSETILLNSSQSTFHFEAPNYPPGVCQGMICRSTVNSTLSNSETEEQKIMLTTYSRYETGEFTIEIQDPNGSALSLHPEKSEDLVLPSSFVVAMTAGTRTLYIKPYSISKGHKCFVEGDGQSITVDNIFESKKVIRMSLKKIEEKLDCWIRIKNHKQKILTIAVKRNIKEYSWRWKVTFSLDQRVEKMFDYYSFPEIFTFSTDEFMQDVSNVNYFYLHFKKLQYYKWTEEEMELNFTLSWKNKCECSKNEYIVDKETLYITSPNYPENYCSGFNCSYSVRAPEGSRIKFQAVHLDLRHGDRLRFQEHNLTRGINYQFETISSTNQLQILFETDRSETASGFKIQLKA